MPKIIEDTDYESSDQSGRTVSVSVEREVDLGSHIMFIGSVTEADVLSDGETVTYGYYQKNIKPKPEKKDFYAKYADMCMTVMCCRKIHMSDLQARSR